MKNAECQNEKAEQNSSYFSFFDLETSPLLLYYYIIINGQRHFLQNSIEKKNKICLCISGEKADQSKMSIMMENALNHQRRMIKHFQFFESAFMMMDSAFILLFYA